VTVNAAAKGAFRVVQVHTAQVLEPNDALKFGKGFFGRCRLPALPGQMPCRYRCPRPGWYRVL
jgi:hypothetical protein